MIRPYLTFGRKRGHWSLRIGWMRLRTDRPCHEYHYIEVRG